MFFRVLEVDLGDLPNGVPRFHALITQLGQLSRRRKMDQRLPGRQTRRNCGGNAILLAEATSNKNRTKTSILIVNYSGPRWWIMDRQQRGPTKNINGMLLSEVAVFLLYRSGCPDANSLFASFYWNAKRNVFSAFRCLNEFGIERNQKSEYCFFYANARE